MRYVQRVLRQHKDVAPRGAATSTELSFFAPATVAERAYPGQADEASMWLYVPSPNLNTYAAQYILSAWVYAAISRLATKAARASAMVFSRTDDVKRFEKHPLMAILGEYGKPNDYQDTYEFMEEHFVNLDLYGNSIWHWVSLRGGSPDEVHVLDPRMIQIRPGRSRRYGDYCYRTASGKEVILHPDSITHFKKHNPYNKYWGISALQAVDVEIRSDKHMALWNDQFFGENVGIPTGIVILPPDVSDADALRIEDEHNARFGTRRRTLVTRGTIGGSVYHPAGAVHKDLDFENGRMISRKAIYETLELPLGMMSETSTEAHARVADRKFYEAIDTRLERSGRKLTSDALPLWAGYSRYSVRFVDDRRDVDDWEQKQKKVETMLQTHSINEVRMKVYGDAPVDWGERKDDGNEGRDERTDSGAAEANEESNGSRRDAGNTSETANASQGES